MHIYIYIYPVSVTHMFRVQALLVLPEDVTGKAAETPGSTPLSCEMTHVIIDISTPRQLRQWCHICSDTLWFKHPKLCFNGS